MNQLYIYLIFDDLIEETKKVEDNINIIHTFN